jgi:hypothetical protein
MYTHTFRNFVRLAAQKVDATILDTWTDYRRDSSPEERIVTIRCLSNEVDVLNNVERLMELAGINAQSHGLRITDSGYLKCNCVKPTMVKFN